MSDTYDLTLSIRVSDRPALLASAIKHAVEVDKLSEEEARAMLADDDEEEGVNVEACLQMLFDPGVSPDGCEIEESRCEWQMSFEEVDL